MCGIAFAVGPGAGVRTAAVRQATRLLQHRGPDAEGFAEFDGACLGHRRLSVIDLRSVAGQPMIDRETGCAIVFNGEIYNHAALRAGLERAGMRFETTSDTEVLLGLLAREGFSCLPRLEGMFAFAFWDPRTNQALLARDRFGEKPLFYAALAEGGVFGASEPWVIADALGLGQSLSPRGFGQLLGVGYTLGEDTMWREIRSLRPGHAISVGSDGRATVTRFADVAAGGAASAAGGRAALARVEDAVRGAVRSELVADVPVGIFLSGGVDSSLVASFAAEAIGAGRVRAFGLGFRDPEFDETGHAADFAARLGIGFQFERLELGDAEFAQAFAASAREPIADTSFLPMWLLSRFARRSVTVVLSGDGGDELFGGYETYVADSLCERLRWLPGPAIALAEAVARRLVPVRHGKVGLDYKMRQFLGGVSLPAHAAHHHWRRLFATAALGDLLQPEALDWALASDGLDEFERAWHESPDPDPLCRAMYTDMKTWLPCDILVKVDRATMAHGLESRAPFLHPAVAATAWGLSRAERVDGRRTKVLLRALARERGAREAAARPKRGFNAPVSRWFAASGSAFARERLMSLSMRRLFREPSLERMLREHAARESDHGFRLLALCVLSEWIERRRSRVVA